MHLIIYPTDVDLHSSDTHNEVIYANLTDEGTIEVEDMVISPEMFELIFPHVEGHPR